MMKNKTFLQKIREYNKFSQSEIANKIGVSRPTFIQIEKGKKDLTLKQLEILSSLYNISIEAIKSEKLDDVKNDKANNIVSVPFPTKIGNFNFNVINQKKGEEIIFLTTKNINNKKPVLVRVHSECMTGDTFHSLRCDCGEQKDRALEEISKYGNGIFIYLRQEGRGIGLYEKIKSYSLQDKGYDTHEANIILGHKPDYREYSWVKKVLDYLEIKEIKLLTNNPNKVSEISRLGIKVIERIPLIIKSNLHNRKYFEAKRNKFKHFFGKEESNYFFQFSYAESSDQVEEIGKFLIDKNKDPFLKICIGVYADTNILDDEYSIKNIESIFKAAELFNGFVPILHFNFRYSGDYKKDILKIRDKMPFVKYLRLNDLDSDYLNTLSFANKFFITDIPLSDDLIYLLEDKKFIDEVINKKTFIMLDNSAGTGKKDRKDNVMNNIDKLLSVGINDIALCGGFGPGNLKLYFDICDHYKFNFSIDAESKLKSGEKLDLQKVKKYLSELIDYKFIKKN